MAYNSMFVDLLGGNSSGEEKRVPDRRCLTLQRGHLMWVYYRKDAKNLFQLSSLRILVAREKLAA